MSKSLEERAATDAGRFAFDPHIEHYFSDNLYAKEIRIPAGAELVQHKHDYGHLSILAEGSVFVDRDDRPSTFYSAPACIHIDAGVHHGIRAVRDAVWFCVHTTHEKDPGRVDQSLIQSNQ